MKKIVALVLSLVMVLGLATTAFAVDAAIYEWDTTNEEWVAGAALTGDIADQALGYDDGYLACYTDGTDFFVEVKEAQATHKLVYGTKTVFLAVVDEDKVAFDVEADVFTNVTKEDDVCGALCVATLTAKDVFYASYDKATKTYTYYQKDSQGNDALLVDGKIVAATELTNTDLTPHAWAGNEVVDYAYVDVKCPNCGKVATLYANGTAAGKNSVAVEDATGTVLGYITAAANGFTAAGTTAGETVESAKTFDAGIAMYVGMSVMAAAGSAVVLKKKD